MVRRDSNRVEEAGCLRISEYFLTPRQECSPAEHFSRMTAPALRLLTVLWVGRRGGGLAGELFRREFPPTHNRNDDPDQRRDRTTDGPGRGVAHLATTKHSESLERPDQTEQCEDQPDRERNDESPSHIGILPAIRSLRPLPHTDRISRFVAGNSPGDRGGMSPGDRLKNALEDGTQSELL